MVGKLTEGRGTTKTKSEHWPWVTTEGLVNLHNILPYPFLVQWKPFLQPLHLYLTIQYWCHQCTVSLDTFGACWAAKTSLCCDIRLKHHSQINVICGNMQTWLNCKCNSLPQKKFCAVTWPRSFVFLSEIPFVCGNCEMIQRRLDK